MTRDEKIRFLDNLDDKIIFHRGNQSDPHSIGTAVMIALEETRHAFAKSVHMENYTKDLNPPAIGTGDTAAIIQFGRGLNSISFKIKVP